MNIIKFIAIALVLTFTSGYTGFCQFHIIPYIDLEIDVDPGYLYPPHQLMLVGMGDENKVVRHVEIKPGIKNYSVYDIKPGKYWLTIRDDNATILFQYQTVTIYDPVKEVFYSENTGYRNEIEAYRNRNLKLKIDFKMHEYYSGYQQVKEIKYRDYDYTELIFDSRAALSSFSTGQESPGIKYHTAVQPFLKNTTLVVRFFEKKIQPKIQLMEYCNSFNHLLLYSVEFENVRQKNGT